MKQYVCLLAMNGNIRGASVGDWVWRRCDILIVLVFWISLGRICLGSGTPAKVGIGHGQLRIFDGFHKVLANIFDLDLILRGWICDGLQGTSLTCFCFPVRLDFTGSWFPLLLLELVKLSKCLIAISFVLI